MNQALGRLTTIAGLALFLGIGILAWGIGATWTPENTNHLIESFAMICGGGIVLVAMLAVIIFGVPIAIRSFGEAGRAQREWQPPDLTYTPRISGYTTRRKSLPPPRPDYEDAEWHVEGQAQKIDSGW